MIWLRYSLHFLKWRRALWRHFLLDCHRCGLQPSTPISSCRFPVLSSLSPVPQPSGRSLSDSWAWTQREKEILAVPLVVLYCRTQWRLPLPGWYLAWVSFGSLHCSCRTCSRGIQSWWSHWGTQWIIRNFVWFISCEILIYTKEWPETVTEGFILGQYFA